MLIKENKSSFQNADLIQMARRENNSKRSFLIVNPSQAKHIPAVPSVTLRLFAELSHELKKYINIDDNILFIGFAETATAIGAGVASHFKNAQYIHTTRELLTDAEMIVEFKELHSHAVQQTLQCKNWNEIIKNKNHIIFIEDEISTGTTIMNFVKALKDNLKVSRSMKFSVCSIINGMTQERTAELLSQGVEFFYLLKISMVDHQDVPIIDPPISFQNNNLSEKKVEYIDIKGHIDSRTGTDMEIYQKAIYNLSADILKSVGDMQGKKISVIGTEEFMYPAVFTAYQIENNCNPHKVVCHSTTRSPIEPHNKEDYPLKSRAVLDSFYEIGRKTYIYNTFELIDKVIVITDSSHNIKKAVETLMTAFPLCNDFLIVRWIK